MSDGTIERCLDLAYSLANLGDFEGMEKEILKVSGHEISKSQDYEIARIMNIGYSTFVIDNDYEYLKDEELDKKLFESKLKGWLVLRNKNVFDVARMNLEEIKRLKEFRELEKKYGPAVT